MTSPLQQKLKINGPIIVTANRTSDGAVVHRTENGGWTTDLDEAAVATTLDAARALLASAAADSVRAIGAYAAPVSPQADGRVGPGNLRERIRTTGPTVAFGADTAH
jgi:predicted NAD/FAD-binding protein